MEISVSEQLYVFLTMVLTGAGAGMLFDLFRVIRASFHTRALSVNLFDLLYWLVMSISVFLILFMVNNGELRWYEVIGLVLGCVIYFLSLSALFQRVIKTLLRFFAKIFLTIFKIVLTPAVFLYKMIKRPLFWVISKIRRLLRRTGRGITQAGSGAVKGLKRLKLVIKKT